MEIHSYFSLAPRPVSLVQSCKRSYQYWGPRFGTDGPHDKTMEKMRALRSMALTCTYFTDRALDELWAAPPGGLYTVCGLISTFRSSLQRIPMEPEDSTLIIPNLRPAHDLHTYVCPLMTCRGTQLTAISFSLCKDKFLHRNGSGLSNMPRVSARSDMKRVQHCIPLTQFIRRCYLQFSN